MGGDGRHPITNIIVNAYLNSNDGIDLALLERELRFAIDQLTRAVDAIGNDSH